mgnify:FL=1
MSDPHDSSRCGRFRVGRLGHSTAGAVSLELVLVFPLVLMLFFLCIQIPHLWIARLVVHYASYCAARSALVSGAAEYDTAGQRAAEGVLAWICIGSATGDEDVELPGVGTIPGSVGVHRKTRVSVTSESDWTVTAEVEFDFALITPIVGPIMAWGSEAEAAEDMPEWYVEEPADHLGSDDDVPLPHLTLRGRVTLPKPYVTVTRAEWPAPGS